MTKRSAVAISAVIIAMLCSLLGVGAASASSGTQGVTATTIRVGIPYVDTAALKAVGVSLNWGNVPDAYKAIIANINEHGGINGRRVVPYIIGVDPTGAAAAATTCTELTQDDKVFVAIAALQPTCYLQNGVPTVAAILEAASVPGLAQNFALAPPALAYDPLQLSVFAKQGVFKNKKVAIFAGVTTDEPEMAIVQAALKKLHVDVVDTAVDSAPQGDLPAENEQVAVIAQRFQTSGVNEVVAVGYGSSIWPESLTGIQSSYNPSWVATQPGDIVPGAEFAPKYLENLVASSPVPVGESVWSAAGTQRCVSLVRKAYPSDHINAYSASLPGSEATWTGVEQACTDLALFAAIAKAAGKHLTVSSFVHAGYGLRNVLLPASSAPVSFGPNQPYPIGPVYMDRYDAATNTFVVSSKSVTK
jgi:hypothetical protein